MGRIECNFYSRYIWSWWHRFVWQIGGIRFLYDNLVEALARYKMSQGFGCVLAHSMGLGKTIQLVAFIDIFLRYTGARHVMVIVPVNTLQVKHSKIPLLFISTLWEKHFLWLHLLPVHNIYIISLWHLNMFEQHGEDTSLTLLTRVTDWEVPRSRLHCNRQVAPQIEHMLFPLGADCSQYIYPNFSPIFIEFDQGKVFLRDFWSRVESWRWNKDGFGYVVSMITSEYWIYLDIIVAVD